MSDTNLVEVLKAGLAENGGYLDVGKGAEVPLGVTMSKLAAAIKELKSEGYPVYYLKLSDQNDTRQVSVKVLTLPKTTYAEVFKNRGQIRKLDPSN